MFVVVWGWSVLFVGCGSLLDFVRCVCCRCSLLLVVETYCLLRYLVLLTVVNCLFCLLYVVVVCCLWVVFCLLMMCVVCYVFANDVVQCWCSFSAAVGC